MSRNVPPNVGSFPTTELAHALIHHCEVYDADWGEEAAVRLVVTHQTWLHRSEFLAHVALGEVKQGARTGTADWAAIAHQVDSSPASNSERAILRLACHLSGHVPDEDRQHWSLAQILMPLDHTVVLIANRAVAMASLGPYVVESLE